MDLILKKDETCSGLKYDRYIFGTPYSPINGAVYILSDVELPEYILLKFKEKEK
jgi:hypothetical protein